MSSHNEQLQPTPFEVAPPPVPEAPRRDARARWLLPALGALLALALLVFFWLPEQVSSPPSPIPGAAPADTPPAQQPATAPAPPPRITDSSPWSEAQLARLRKEAQEVLEGLLERQFALEERGVGQWAPEDFAAAGAAAAAGDELYRQRRYQEAAAQYAEALAGMQALQARVPEEFAAQLALAGQAIEAGEREAAADALALAALIDPENPALPPLQRRAGALAQLLPLLEQAAAAERSGDLGGAEQFLEQAAALDPLHRHTRAELERVAAGHRAQRFNEAMSEGYAALEENRFGPARTAFRRAAEIAPESGETATALQEVEAAATAHRLATLKQQGLALERKEQWREAVAVYEQALQVDGSVLFAQEGLQRSRPRAQLDKQLGDAIGQPGRLSDAAVAEATGQLLQRAEGVSPRGALLARQIESLRALLAQANTPVSVTLRSDAQTEVIVYKVARLGRFEERELTLRPGTYTAVGSRNGYRDVRRQFTVAHDGTPAAVTIICTEKI
jgi:tetratricopeptide (TPR) repeat protein